MCLRKAHNPMDLLFPVVCTLIDRDAKSSSVRDALTEFMSFQNGANVSHKRVNKLLTEMVDEGKLYRIQIGKQQYYAHDKYKSLCLVIGEE